MLVQVEPRPICLEVLNMRDRPVAQIAANLQHLTGDNAVITITNATPTPCLHWGSRIRFEMETETQRFVVTGSVMALQARSVNGSTTVQDGTDRAEGLREAHLRLWDCRAVTQRRDTARHRAGFAVRYCSPGADSGLETEPEWHAAECVDISAGGAKLRVLTPEVLPEHITLEIAQPDETTPLVLTGQVLRTERARRDGRRTEMAIKFERPGVQEGLTLIRLMKKE